MAIKSFYIKESQLDIQQKDIVDRRLDLNLVVTGGAGSGKSVLALWKAKAIQDKGESVLYVVKTVALTRFMKDGVSSVGLHPGTICSFNKCFYWRKNEDDEWVKGSWKLDDHYDYIILDEATDLDESEVRELIKHCTYFIAFGDNDQQLYSFKDTTTTIEDIASELSMNDKIDYLLYNHRLPKKIARLVIYAHPSIVPNSTDAKTFVTRCTSEGPELPHIFRFQDEESQFDEIIKIINNKNGGLKDVGILFRDRESMRRAYNYFISNDLPVSMITDSQFIGQPFESDAPKLMTYHGSKGLQFETVFIPNCPDSYDRAPLYVALTRTYAYLYIMHTGSRPSAFSMVPESMFDSNNGTNLRRFTFSQTSNDTEKPF